MASMTVQFGHRLFAAGALAAALGAAGCAARNPEADAPAQNAGAPAGPATAKAGAAVTVTAEQRGSVAPGAVGTVTFTFSEDLDAGSMSVSARGSAGLDLIPAEPRTTMAMLGRTQHAWDVSFRAATEGVYYVDLFIETTSAGGVTETRSHSARVTVGQAGKPAAPAVKTEMIDGEPVVVLEAQEVVVD
ncbi:MAG: hypothetical protein U5J99_10555 [Parvularculaceae bacterium]|nr:hypothetical protein [Parvularculaceae bacterium]